MEKWKKYYIIPGWQFTFTFWGWYLDRLSFSRYDFLHIFLFIFERKFFSFVFPFWFWFPFGLKKTHFMCVFVSASNWRTTFFMELWMVNGEQWALRSSFLFSFAKMVETHFGFNLWVQRKKNRALKWVLGAWICVCMCAFGHGCIYIYANNKCCWRERTATTKSKKRKEKKCEYKAICINFHLPLRTSKYFMGFSFFVPLQFVHCVSIAKNHHHL